MVRRVGEGGFALVELAVCVAVLGLLAALAYPAYVGYVRRAALEEVRAAMMKDMRFMEQHYRLYGRFKKNSTTWPDLPVTGTERFCIRLHGVARGAAADKYTLKAVAFDKEGEPRVLKMNEQGHTVLCAYSANSCSDPGGFFTGQHADKQCRVFP